LKQVLKQRNTGARAPAAARSPLRERETDVLVAGTVATKAFSVSKFIKDI